MITPQIAVFLVLAAVTVAGAVSLILQRHPIHSALSLIVVMVALAGLYLLQGAEFVAADVQIIVYAGAIMVLFIFVIMLLNAGEEERANVSRLARFVGVPLGICVPRGSGLLDWTGHVCISGLRRRRRFRRATCRRCFSANTCFRLS